MSETAVKKNRTRVNTAANVNKKPRKTKKKAGAIDPKELDEMVGISVKNDKTDIYSQVSMLMSKTGQDKNSILAYHKNFVAECPTGQMTKTQFVKLTKVNHPTSYSDYRTKVSIGVNISCYGPYGPGHS